MARYIEDVKIDQPLDVVSMAMEDFIYHSRFTRTDWQGEPVYCCKDGANKERYMKWAYTNGVFHIEAWLKNAFGKETNLNGGSRSKREYRESIERLIRTLRTHSGNAFAGSYIGHDPIQHSPMPSFGQATVQPSQQPIYSRQTQQPTNRQSAPQQTYQSTQQKASAGSIFLLGILGIVFAFMMPLIGAILGTVGLRRVQGGN